MTEYLTTFARILDEFFKCLSDCGLMTSYTVQLQSNINSLETVMKFRTVIEELVTNLQGLLSSIPAVESTDASTQTVEESTEVVLTCHPISLSTIGITKSPNLTVTQSSDRLLDQEFLDKPTDQCIINNRQPSSETPHLTNVAVSSIQICELKPIILETSGNIAKLVNFTTSGDKTNTRSREADNIVHIVVEAADNHSEPVFDDTSQENHNIVTEQLPCSKCDQKFESGEDLKTHLQSHHQSEETNIYCCDMCDKTFSCIQALQEHCKQDHDGVGCFSCTICSRRFMTKISCTRHMETHKGTKDATCEICGKAFSRADYLQTHYSIHLGKRSYACSQCPRKFVRRIHLQAHEKIHSGVKDHVCKVCNKAFGRSDKLREHMMRHLNIKRFQCPVCKREYAEKRDLKVHLKTHDKLS